LKKYPFWFLVLFSTLFLIVGVPSLVIGAFDTANRELFIVTAILVVPQMIGLSVCTWTEWKERKKV